MQDSFPVYEYMRDARMQFPQWSPNSAKFEGHSYVPPVKHAVGVVSRFLEPFAGLCAYHKLLNINRI